VDELIALTSALVLPRSKSIQTGFTKYKNASLVLPVAHFFCPFFDWCLRRGTKI